MMTIRQAVPADLMTVGGILRSVSDWLHSRGYDQWPTGSPSLGPAKLGEQIARGEFWVVAGDDDPVAVIAISSTGDTDFWTLEELAEPACYVSKAAVVRRRAGEDLGALLLRWACDWAAGTGARLVRLDAWKTNQELHSYYRRQGWRYLRTVHAPNRNSGALFQRDAVTDLDARTAFTLRGAPPPTPPAALIGAGASVLVDTDAGPTSARVVQVTADWSHGITEAGWEHGEGSPPRLYVVERGGRRWTAHASEVWPNPDQPQDPVAPLAPDAA